jgi:predicted negative regulator of RcsB-dependent stress response
MTKRRQKETMPEPEVSKVMHWIKKFGEVFKVVVPIIAFLVFVAWKVYAEPQIDKRAAKIAEDIFDKRINVKLLTQDITDIKQDIGKIKDDNDRYRQLVDKMDSYLRGAGVIK